MAARQRQTVNIISSLIDAIDAHGEMRRETIERAATLGLYFVAAADAELARHVDRDQLERLAAAHPGCRDLTPGGADWTLARLDCIADGIPGSPGVGETDAAGYFAGESIECDGLLVDVTPIRDTLRDWMVRRATARRGES